MWYWWFTSEKIKCEGAFWSVTKLPLISFLLVAYFEDGMRGLEMEPSSGGEAIRLLVHQKIIQFRITSHNSVYLAYFLAFELVGFAVVLRSWWLRQRHLHVSFSFSLSFVFRLSSLQFWKRYALLISNSAYFWWTIGFSRCGDRSGGKVSTEFSVLIFFSFCPLVNWFVSVELVQF